MFPFFLNQSKNGDKKEKEASDEKKHNETPKSLFTFKTSLFQNKSPIFKTNKNTNQNQQSPSRKPIPLSCSSMTTKTSPSHSHNSTGTLAFLRNEAKSKLTIQNKLNEKAGQENPKQNNNTINFPVTKKSSKATYNGKKYENNISSNLINDNFKNTVVLNSFSENNTTMQDEVKEINKKKKTRKPRKRKNQKEESATNLIDEPPNQEEIYASYFTQDNIPVESSNAQQNEEPTINPIEFPNPSSIEIQTDDFITNSEENTSQSQKNIPKKKTKSKKDSINDNNILDISSNSDEANDSDDFYYENIEPTKYNKSKMNTRKRQKKSNNFNKNLDFYGFLNVKTRSQQKTLYSLNDVQSICFYNGLISSESEDEFEKVVPIKKRKENKKKLTKPILFDEVTNHEEINHRKKFTKLRKIKRK